MRLASAGRLSGARRAVPLASRYFLFRSFRQLSCIPSSEATASVRGLEPSYPSKLIYCDPTTSTQIRGVGIEKSDETQPQRDKLSQEKYQTLSSASPNVANAVSIPLVCPTMSWRAQTPQTSQDPPRDVSARRRLFTMKPHLLRTKPLQDPKRPPRKTRPDPAGVPKNATSTPALPPPAHIGRPTVTAE